MVSPQTPQDSEPSASPATLNPTEPLSDVQISIREHEVLLQVLDGATNGEIASSLGIAEVTVKKHLTSVNRKLGATDRRSLRRGFSLSSKGSDAP